MLAPINALTNSHSPLLVLDGAVVLALVIKGIPDVVVAGCRVGMLLAQCLCLTQSRRAAHAPPCDPIGEDEWAVWA